MSSSPRVPALRSLMIVFGLATASPGLAVEAKMTMAEEARAQTKKLTEEISWHRELPAALDQARREGKLVFWIQMLGDIDGST